MPNTWKEILDPIIAKFNAAWLGKDDAIWNAEGSKAMAGLLTDMQKHLDNGDDFFIPKNQVEKELQEKDEKIARTMSDHGRMLWKEDVEGHCDDTRLCFEYGDTVRCGPCAIKQATAAGVATINQDMTYNPQEARLRREIVAKDEEIARLKEIILRIPESIREKIKEVEANNAYWGGPHKQAYPDAPDILKDIEDYLESMQK